MKNGALTKKTKKLVVSLLLFFVPTGVGIPVGAAIYTFYYAQGHSYLTDNPEACMNCHIMKPQFDAWNQSTHRAVAQCNDCHAPSDLTGKYITKAINGFNHSWAFTFQNFKEPIQIKDWNLKIAEQSCLKCHSEITSNIRHYNKDKTTSCTSCHKGVGH